MQIDFSRRQFCRGAIVAGLLGAPAAVRADNRRVSLDDVNRMDQVAFVQAFGDVYELSPWVAKTAYAKRPFATVTALHQALIDVFANASRDQQLKFFHDLSDIGDKSAKAGTVTANSHSEQGTSGVDSLGPEDQALLEAMTKAYRAKFNMAFTICNRRSTKATIFSEYMRRLRNSLDEEIALQLREQFFITRLRLAEQVSGPGMPRVYGDMSTHVINSMIGAPAEGVAVEIFELWGDRSYKVAVGATNAEGRAMLMEGKPLPIGRYELRFAIGDFFRKMGVTPAAQKPFLDIVPMRFYIANSENSYHVPLVVSPYGYSIHV
jgi:2-oxo-4-hydroxy-4-carboxy-5-ureidoimidazoline decarboxylase